MGFFAPGGPGIAKLGIGGRTTERAGGPRWGQSALTLALLAPVPGGAVVWLLLVWLRRLIEAL